MPLHAYLVGDEIETMAQSSTRGACVVPAVWLGVQAGETVLWMVAHPAVDAIMAADTSISRHELNRFVLFIVSSFRCSKFPDPTDATTAPSKRHVERVRVRGEC